MGKDPLPGKNGQGGNDYNIKMDKKEKMAVM